MIGAVVGGYTIGARLGSGATGIVYAATGAHGHDVAIKVLRPELAGPGAIGRLLGELERVRGLASPHVARVLDVVRDPPMVVMERLEGRSLAKIIEERGPQPADVVTRLGHALCDALAEAHAIGLLHRDLKPENVFVCARGPKLLDFGLAALAEPGALVGTIAFMSPEQARGEPATARSDLHGVGATLYVAACGHRPFDAPNEAALLARVEEGGAPPLPASVPPALAAVIARAMSRAPEDRFADAAEMSRALGA